MARGAGRGWNEGLDASLRAYMQSPDATLLERDEEDLAPLARFDRELLQQWLTPPARVADLGCGTGRLALDLARRGFEVVAIDLSSSRLARLASRIEPGSRLLPVRSNLCEQGILRPSSFDAALLMYSTLGMVRGRRARVDVLRRALSALRPNGRLILHAHSFWANLHPSSLGPRIQRAGWPSSGWLDRLGDSPTRYAGVPDVLIHVYRWRELRLELGQAGFAVTRTLPLARGSGGPLASPRWLPALRADGWIVEARPLQSAT